MAAPASTQSAEPQINAPFSKQTNSLMVWLIVPIYLARELRSRSEKSAAEDRWRSEVETELSRAELGRRTGRSAERDGRRPDAK